MLQVTKVFLLCFILSCSQKNQNNTDDFFVTLQKSLMSAMAIKKTSENSQEVLQRFFSLKKENVTLEHDDIPEDGICWLSLVSPIGHYVEVCLKTSSYHLRYRLHLEMATTTGVELNKVLLNDVIAFSLTIDNQSSVKSLKVHAIVGDGEDIIKRNFTVPLFNLNPASIDNVWDKSFIPTEQKLFSDMSTHKSIRSVWYIFHELYSEDVTQSFRNTQKDFFGARKCHDVDDDCLSLMDNSCHKCRYGVTEVFTNRCPEGGRKYCITEYCGGQGERACYRGRLHHIIQSRSNLGEKTSEELKEAIQTTACDNLKKSVFCHDRLVAVCEGDEYYCR